MNDEKIKNIEKPKGGLGGLLANKQALMALGMGLTAVSRPGGNFNMGVARGLSAYDGMNSQRLAQEKAELEAKISNTQQERVKAYISQLPPEQQALAMMDSGNFVKQAQAAEFKSEKGSATSKQKDFQFLKENGMSDADAFKAIYGREQMSVRSNPDGSFELVQGVGGDGALGAMPKLREQEAKFGLFATQAQDSHEQLVDLEKRINPTSAENAAFTIARETPLLGRFAEMIPNEDMKQYEAELGRFIDGWARAMTGAAMPDSERVFYKSMIGARPGDGPDVRARKARNRKVMADSLQAGAGEGSAILERVRSQMVDPTSGDTNAPASDDADIDALIEQYRSK